MTIRPTELTEVLLVEPKVFGDDRGFFFECYKADRYVAVGIACEFVQDNVSYSKAGVIRGLHYQWPNPQAKLIQVLSGAVFDVAVDIRRGSPTYGKWIGEVLSAENHHQLFIPPGFAHGFAVLGDHALVSYKCSTLYEAAGDCSVRWNDPEIGVEWPISEPMLSGKDAAALKLADISPERLPRINS